MHWAIEKAEESFCLKLEDRTVRKKTNVRKVSYIAQTNPPPQKKNPASRTWGGDAEQMSGREGQAIVSEGRVGFPWC